MPTHVGKGRRGSKKTQPHNSHPVEDDAKRGMLKYFAPAPEEDGREQAPKKAKEVSYQTNGKADEKDSRNGNAETPVPQLPSPTKLNKSDEKTALPSPKKAGMCERNGEGGSLKPEEDLKSSGKGDEPKRFPSTQGVDTRAESTDVPSAGKQNGFLEEKTDVTTNPRPSVRKRRGRRATSGRVRSSPSIVRRPARSKASKLKKKESKITSYFYVRKSDRLTESQVKEKKLELLKQAILSCSEDSLKVMQFEGKGRGVVAARDFAKGEFVVEYRGELISRFEALKREKTYQSDSSIGCYMYYFTFRDKQYCVDATEETEYKARLINHSAKEPNCVPKIVEVNNRPRIALIAARDVSVGEELLYNYGDRSRAAVAAHPWLINS